MRPPSVDEFRQPFVEPLGHLVLNAAQADMALLELCAIVNKTGADEASEQSAYGEATRKLRNHDKKAEAYLTATIAKIDGDFWKEAAADAIARFVEARKDRHRAIHDVVDVGAFGNGEDGYYALPLRRKYEPTGELKVSKITPTDIMQLAHRYHIIWMDLDVLISVATKLNEGEEP
jgi:hypothetical protein